MEQKEVISEYLAMVSRYKYLIILTILIFAGVGYMFYKFEVPTYSAHIDLVIEQRPVVTSYDIGNVQQIEEIYRLAKGYSVVSEAIGDLNLTSQPLKKDFIQRVISGNATYYLGTRELTFHYMHNVQIKTTKTGVITVTVTSQNPYIAASLANRIGKILITRNIKARENKIARSINYIDGQLETIRNLISEQREQKTKSRRTINYIEAKKLQDKIDSDQNTLALLLKEQEHLRAKEVLETIDRAETDTQERLNIVTTEIEEITQTIDEDKEILAELDKTDIYREEELEFSIEANQAQYARLLSDKQQIVLASLLESRHLRFISNAQVPISPNTMRGLLYVVIFVIIGLAADFGIIQVREAINSKFKSSKDVEKTLHANVIGNLPIISKKEEIQLIDPKGHPKSMITESYRTLATNIKFAIKDKKVKTIAFSSDKPGTGKSYTVSNLGIIMAEAGHNVLLVDADLRKPNLHKLLNKNRKPGITDVLAGKASLKKSIIRIKEKLHLLPSGSLAYNPESVIESNAMKKLMKTIEKRYDFILFDSIPLTSFSDIAILASETDASILVMDEKKSGKETMEFAKERLDEIGSNVLGVAINRTKRRYKKYYHEYYYYSKEKKRK